MSDRLNFDDRDHTGFSRGVDPMSARRQLRMSVGVAVVLAVATAICVMALRPAYAVSQDARDIPTVAHGVTGR